MTSEIFVENFIWHWFQEMHFDNNTQTPIPIPISIHILNDNLSFIHWAQCSIHNFCFFLFNGCNFSWFEYSFFLRLFLQILVYSVYWSTRNGTKKKQIRDAEKADDTFFFLFFCLNEKKVVSVQFGCAYNTLFELQILNHPHIYTYTRLMCNRLETKTKRKMIYECIEILTNREWMKNKKWK